MITKLTTTSTGSSDEAGGYTDLITAYQVDESNGAASFAAVAQLNIIGIDPTDSANGMYTAAERQIQ